MNTINNSRAAIDLIHQRSALAAARKTTHDAADPTITPLVSIYIPTKNRLQLLKRAIASVFAQTYSNIELIVADDGSTDGTREYLNELLAAGQIKLILTPSSMGACVARNLAIAASTGQFVTGLDDDDYFLPQRIDDFVATWRAIDPKGSPVAGLYHSARLLLPAGEEVCFTGIKQTADDLKRSNAVGTQVFAPRAHYIEAGLFDPAMPCWQDWDLWTRMAIRFGAFLGGGTASYVWDMSDPHGHISSKPAFMIRHGYRLFTHKYKLSTRKSRVGPLRSVSLYPQIWLRPGEFLTLAFSSQWKQAIKYAARRILGEDHFERIRLFLKKKNQK